VAVTRRLSSEQVCERVARAIVFHVRVQSVVQSKGRANSITNPAIPHSSMKLSSALGSQRSLLRSRSLNQAINMRCAGAVRPRAALRGGSQLQRCSAAARPGAAAPLLRHASLPSRPRARPLSATAPARGAPKYTQELPEKFDLGIAVAMAAAAFEAYLEPAGGSFKEISVNDTETSYTSRYARMRMQLRGSPAFAHASTACARMGRSAAAACSEPGAVQPTNRQLPPPCVGPLYTSRMRILPTRAHPTRDFLMESFSGILDITLHGAKGLKGVNKVRCILHSSGGCG